MKYIKALSVLCIALILQSCSSADRYPVGIITDAKFVTDSACELTRIEPIFEGEVSEVWKNKIKASSLIATNILKSPEFTSACQNLSLSRTLGKSVQEVCREMVCSGLVNPIVSLFNKPNTLAIAYEENGKLHINTAKENAGAGSPGNMAHEFTHTLGYTHFSNWAWLGKSSVPYRIGNLIDKLNRDAEKHAK